MDEQRVAKFWSRVKRGGPDECWEWMGSRLPTGYGHFYHRISEKKYTTRYAHRTAYELTNGAIPQGMHVCHTCDNPACCNPTHLWVGTHKDNMHDRNRKGRDRGMQVIQAALDEKRRLGMLKGTRRAKRPGVGRIYGTNHHLARLSPDLVREMRELHSNGWGVKRLAKRFGVGKSTAHKVIKRMTWKEVA